MSRAFFTTRALTENEIFSVANPIDRTDRSRPCRDRTDYKNL